MRLEEIKNVINKYKNVEYGKVFNFAQMEENYEEYVKNIDGKKIRFGIPTIDNALGLIRPTQVVTFIGTTNVGKTALAMNICFANATILKEKLIILVECEIDENEIYERAVQMEFDLNTWEVESAFKKKDQDSINKFKTIKSKYQNVIGIIFRINIDEIPAYIKSIEEIYKKQCGLLIIDYIGLVRNKFSDEYDKITYSMQMLKEIALHLQIPVINLSQTSRGDVKSSKKGLNLYSGKSSGEIENSSQIVITLDRVKNLQDNGLVPKDVLNSCTGDKPSHYLIKATIQKKKQGDYAETYLLFNKKNLRINDISPETLPFKDDK